VIDRLLIKALLLHAIKQGLVWKFKAKNAFFYIEKRSETKLRVSANVKSTEQINIFITSYQRKACGWTDFYYTAVEHFEFH